MRLVRASLVIVWLVLGCGGGDDSDLDSGTAPQIWCRGVCQAQRDCGASAGWPCEQECVGDRPGLSNISQDGARALRPCLAGLSCQELSVATEWDEAMDACWEGAQRSVDVAGYARSFCTVYAAAWFECGFFWPVSECERAYSMWEERVIDRLAPCLDSPSCDALLQCDETTWSTL